MRTVGASTHTHTPCLSLVVRLSTLQAYILRLTAHLSYVLVEGDRRGRVLQEHVGHADLERCQLGPEPGTRDKTRGGGGGCGGLNNTRCGGGRELGRVEQRGGDLRRQSKKKSGHTFWIITDSGSYPSYPLPKTASHICRTISLVMRWHPRDGAVMVTVRCAHEFFPEMICARWQNC